MSSSSSSSLLCPICFNYLEEAHVTHCGHSFCLSCIRKALAQSPCCPKCAQRLEGEQSLFPNLSLNDVVGKLKRESKQGHKMEKLLDKGASPWQLQEVDYWIAKLKDKRRRMERETKESRHRLLRTFLVGLKEQKDQSLFQLEKEAALVANDLEKVERGLEEGDEDQEGQDLSLQRQRLHTHFDELSECYFNLRASSVALPSSSSSSLDSLDAFSKCLSRFTHYNAVTPLATLSYTADMFNNASIVSSIEFDKDNEFFAIAGVTKRIKVYDYNVVLKDMVDIHYPTVEMTCSSKISCISWNSFQKSSLASSDYEGTVILWDTATSKKNRSFQEHEKRCWSVDFNVVDSKLLASGSDDARVKVWSSNAPNSVASLEAKANVCCVKFNPNSCYHLAFGSADHCVHYYDLRNTKSPLALFKGHRKAVSYVKFLDKDTLISASTDSQLKMWDLSNSKLSVRSFHGHINEKNFVGLATDGDFFTCGSENNALYVYYKGLSKPLFHFKFDGPKSVLDRERKEEETSEFVSAVCWRKDTNVIVGANSQGTIKILELK